MEFEIRQLQCEHPFGEGIHVMVPPPEPELMVVLLHSLKIDKEFAKDYVNLKTLVTPTQSALACRLYQGVSPKPELGPCYAIISTKIMPDFLVYQTVVILLIEKGWEKEGKMVAEMFHRTIKEQDKK